MRLRAAALLATSFLTISACAAGVDDLSQIGTVVAGTMQAEAELAGTVSVQVEQTLSALATELSTPVPSETPTTTPIPTETLTPTPDVVTISVSANTNCRTGPGSAYEYRGTLLVGLTVEAIAISSAPNYWYIANLNRPGEFCWLWGGYATVEGDTSVLPAYTPLPVPTPNLPFTLQVSGFVTCGGTDVVIKIHNTGFYTFTTAERQVIDLNTSEDLNAPELDRHPFAPGSFDCPAGHDNQLVPDQVAYIYIPIGSAPSGHSARATIRVCTEDYLGGTCFTQRADFTFP